MDLDPMNLEHAAARHSERPLPPVRYSFTCEGAPEQLWLVRRVEFIEELSRPYELIVDLLSEELEVDVEALLGSSCQVSIERETLHRLVCGVVQRVETRGRTEDRARVRIFVVPALRLLEHRVDTRLWQDMSTVEIVEEVLTAGLADYDRELVLDKLAGDYSAREYVVQYRESDLDFVSRLLEHEGISYHFDHEDGSGRELLVLEDSADNWAEIPTIDDEPTLRVIRARAEQAEVESLQGLEGRRSLASTTISRRAFDWREPTQLRSTRVGDADERGSTRELYRHGAVAEDELHLQLTHELRRQTDDARARAGASNVTGLAPGRRFRLADDTEFLITRVVHRGAAPEGELGGGAQDEPTYVNEFECLPFDGQPWRPPVRTPKPRIPGPQTALVTGPEGEEIHTDEHGRVKVRFHWDRRHALSDDSSMWIRAAQAWAGSGFGLLFIPRVGMEVVVEFIEGDPDQPLVTGCVHNGPSRSSVALPDDKTQSTLRTRSSPGGEGFNELRFEDAAGAEEIYLHAQRDLRETILRNHRAQVHVDRVETVGRDHKQEIRGEQTLTIDGKRSEIVGGDEDVRNKGKREVLVEGDERLEVVGHTTALHYASHERRIAGARELHVIRPKSGKAARSRTFVEGEHELEVDEHSKTTAGDKLELIQGKPASQAQIGLQDGKICQLAEHEWRATAGEFAELRSECRLQLRGSKHAELAQGNAFIRIQNDTVEINASKIRLVVGDNTFMLNEKGLESVGKGVDMTALGTVTISGATVSID